MHLSTAATAFSFLLFLPHGAVAQLGAGAGAGAGWAPPSAGVRVGYDDSQQGYMVGALIRVPVLRNGSVELMPNADVTFLPDFKEYQVNFELVYLTAGREGGLYAGGGLGFRNSTFSGDPNADRRTERTFSVVAGVRLGGLGFLRPQLETRWILQDEWSRDPRHVAIGLALRLWGP
jgi:hypothetical protein